MTPLYASGCGHKMVVHCLVEEGKTDHMQEYLRGKVPLEVAHEMVTWRLSNISATCKRQTEKTRVAAASLPVFRCWKDTMSSSK
jgi:hypothetical protein